MGEYNPNAGMIVGQEWVPIVDAPLLLSPEQEVGWTFDLPSAEVVSSGKVYPSEVNVDSHVTGLTHQFVPIDTLYTMVGLYPQGTEARTGPLKQSIVEISGATTSGTPSGFTFSGAASLRDAIYRPGDHASANVLLTATTAHLFMNFDFNAHTELTGKRIVKIEFLYVLEASPGFAGSGTPVLPALACLFQDVGTPATLSPLTNVPMVTTAEILAQTGLNFDTFPAVTLPNQNIIVDGVVPASFATFAPTSAYPWTYEKLKLFDVGAGARQQTLEFHIYMPTATETIQLNYAALRVTYCEEQRVAFGGLVAYINPNSSEFDMRAPDLIPNGALIPAGKYTLTVEGGELDTEIFGSREVRQLPGQQGLVIDRTTRVDETFTSSPTDQLVMLSIHRVDGSIIPGPHGYGPPVESDSYTWPDTLQTRQGIVNASRAGTVEYPTARFYARRFADTAQPLTLTHSTIPATTAQITVEEFDALPEITHGWKQVDVTFSAPVPTFDNSGTITEYYWSSNAPVGAGWQVLGASSFARNESIPSVPITGSDAPFRNNYGTDQAYFTVDAVAQTTMDATLIFAQEMPAVSGLALTQEVLAVTGIGLEELECGVPLDCIPTGINYHALTWEPLGAASVPASGFGFYELQRQDDIDTTWNTILYASSPLITGFSDFEPRVGVESRYRIRFQHKLLFPSAWSAEVPGTLPVPGITGVTTNDGTGVLIFTTNERQTGNSSLAYAMVWENRPEEQFTFLEASERVLQKMYDRDYQVAFRPLERGGEQFTRTLLVQAAAVPGALLQRGFTSLRDLAWEQVSYVCVRDGLGDRWLANVNVPEGTVQGNRSVYLAQVQITEVTATPSIVMLPSALQGGGSGAGSGCITALWDALPGWDYGCWAD